MVSKEEILNKKIFLFKKLKNYYENHRKCAKFEKKIQKIIETQKACYKDAANAQNRPQSNRYIIIITTKATQTHTNEFGILLQELKGLKRTAKRKQQQMQQMQQQLITQTRQATEANTHTHIYIKTRRTIYERHSHDASRHPAK